MIPEHAAGWCYRDDRLGTNRAKDCTPHSVYYPTMAGAFMLPNVLTGPAQDIPYSSVQLLIDLPVSLHSQV